MEVVRCVTRSITHELHFKDTQRDQMEGGGRVTRSIIEELHSSEVLGDQK